MGCAQAPLTMSYTQLLLALTVQKRCNQDKLADALLNKLTPNNLTKKLYNYDQADAQPSYTLMNNS
jgi:hypothetical protein